MSAISGWVFLILKKGESDENSLFSSTPSVVLLASHFCEPQFNADREFGVE
jgi:hypothetical protein